MLMFNLPSKEQDRSQKFWPYLLAYNLGRIGSYTVAGAMAGGLGGLLVEHAYGQAVATTLHLLAGLVMIGAGLYLTGLAQGFAQIESIGVPLWRWLEPMGRAFLPVKTPFHALMLGIFWGWLPCGLVYSVLIMSLGQGGWWQGGLLLLSFGLGTLPTLVALGGALPVLRGFMAGVWFKRTAGALVMAWGGSYLAAAFM